MCVNGPGHLKLIITNHNWLCPRGVLESILFKNDFRKTIFTLLLAPACRATFSCCHCTYVLESNLPFERLRDWPRYIINLSIQNFSKRWYVCLKGILLYVIFEKENARFRTYQTRIIIFGHNSHLTNQNIKNSLTTRRTRGVTTRMSDIMFFSCDDAKWNTV